ncbi:hypothetical protein [Halalkalibacter okhensis]|uniref:hypothetical protein n=1 Tax=Halalkalibacter okhensis TaxID=333138 RepID=UPI00068B8C84|nr:hypothetical protein [Halalkalibacter okhensis]
MRKIKLLAVSSLIIGGVFTGYLVVANATGPTEGNEYQSTSIEENGSEAKFLSFTGVIAKVENTESSTTIIVEDDSSEMIFPIDDETVIASTETDQLNSEIIEGQFVTIYYDKDKPIPMIYPPTITPEIIIVGEESLMKQSKVSKFDQHLVSEDNELKLHISSDTVIVNSNGEALDEADIIDKTLVVSYTITTRSIPAQTTPHMIIVLDE